MGQTTDLRFEKVIKSDEWKRKQQKVLENIGKPNGRTNNIL